MNISAIHSNNTVAYPPPEEFAGSQWSPVPLSGVDSVRRIPSDQMGEETGGFVRDMAVVDVYTALKLQARLSQVVWGRLNEMRHIESVYIEKAGTLSVESSRSRGVQSLIGAIIGGVGQVIGGAVQGGCGVKAGMVATKSAIANHKSMAESTRAQQLSTQGETTTTSAQAAADQGSQRAGTQTVAANNAESAARNAAAAHENAMDLRLSAQNGNDRSQAISTFGGGAGQAIGGLASAAKAVYDFNANEDDAKRSFQDLRARAHESDLQANDTTMRQRQDDEREALQTLRSVQQMDLEMQRNLARA